MKIISTYFILIFCMLLSTFDLEARGGGRGGGGRGGGRAGGAHRSGGGRTMNRSPSMSRTTRPATRPASRPATRPNVSRPTTRPNVSKPNITRQGQGNFNRPNQRITGAQSAANKDKVQNFLKNRPSTLPANTSGKNIKNAIGNRQNIGNNIKNNIASNRPNYGDWFNKNFYDNHKNSFNFDNGRNAWKWATAVGLTGYLGWRNIQPYYYGGYVDGTYYDGYYTGTYDGYDTSGTSPPPPQTQQTYEQQSQAITTAASDQPTGSDWMPLGVFALSKSTDDQTTPNIFVQLAVNKDGDIAGTYYNSITDQTYQAEGLVDQESQRAAWKIVDNDESPIVETGIFNLTEAEAPAKVYFENGNTQDMLLVRLDNPGNS